MTLASFMFGVCTISFGLVPNFWVYLGIMVLCGLAMPVYNTPATVLLQEKVEEEYMGRVFGVLGMISSSMMPLGMLLFGPLADVAKIEWMLIGTGILMLVEGILLLRSKVLMDAGEPIPKTELAAADDGVQ
jgi:MFS transporter, DHA3 family, macrolide efflux protein